MFCLWSRQIRLLSQRLRNIDCDFVVNERRFRGHCDLPAEELQRHRRASNAQSPRGSCPFDGQTERLFNWPVRDEALPWKVARGRSQPHPHSRIRTTKPMPSTCRGGLQSALSSPFHFPISSFCLLVSNFPSFS